MYKGKIKIWIILLTICLFVQCITTLIPKISKEKQTIYLNISSEYDPFISETINGKKIKNYITRINKESPDIIFSDTEPSNISLYTKYENYAQTPLILYMPSYATTEYSGFTIVDAKNYHISPLKIDLYAILTAMEENKKWSDLGIHKNVAKDEVLLTIPSNTSKYYDAIVELFYFTLNEYNPVTPEIKEQLKDRVDNILNKCEKVEDIAESIIEAYKSNNKEKKVFIGPEYLYLRGGNEMSRTNKTSYRPIYLTETIIFTMDMYVKKEKTDTIEKFLEFTQNKHHFAYRMGWRINDVNYPLDKIDCSLIDFVPGYYY